MRIQLTLKIGKIQVIIFIKKIVNEKNSDHDLKIETINNDVKDIDEGHLINIKEFKIENEEEKNNVENNCKISDLDNGSGKKDKTLPPKNVSLILNLLFLGII